MDVDGTPGRWGREAVFFLDADHGLAENYRRQVYALGVTLHEGVHFGLFTVLEWPKDETEDPTADVTRIYLGTSRDGVHFDLRWIYNGQFLIKSDPKGRPRRNSTQDYQSMRPAAQFVSHAGQHWLYYESCPHQHERRYLGGCEIWLARFRKDGLAYLAAANEQWGHVTTRKFVLRGSRLELNVQLLNARGSVKVAVLDASGKAIPGYSCQDTIRVRSGQHALVEWKRSLEMLTGSVIQLRLCVHMARLYALQILE